MKPCKLTYVNHGSLRFIKSYTVKVGYFELFATGKVLETMCRQEYRIDTGEETK